MLIKRKKERKILTITTMITMVITLFKSINTFYRTKSIVWNIPIYSMNMENIIYNDVNPTKQCYEFE